MMMNRRGLSELLSSLILLAVAIAVTMILVSYLPVAEPPSARPWMVLTVVDAYTYGGDAYICLYNPYSEPITVLEAWIGESKVNVGQEVRPHEAAWIRVQGTGDAERLLLRLSTGAIMGVDLA